VVGGDRPGDGDRHVGKDYPLVPLAASPAPSYRDEMMTPRQLPGDETPPLTGVYDDARAMAVDYPVVHLPDPADADPAAVEQQWQALIAEMAQHPGLAGRYYD
jgi:hypothetical protein